MKETLTCIIEANFSNLIVEMDAQQATNAVKDLPSELLEFRGIIHAHKLLLNQYSNVSVSLSHRNFNIVAHVIILKKAIFVDNYCIWHKKQMKFLNYFILD